MEKASNNQDGEKSPFINDFDRTNLNNYNDDD